MLRDVTPPRWLRIVVLIAVWIPLALAVAGIASDFFRGTRWFGSNPIKEVEHFTGKWALRFLLFTLAITPARRLLGWNWLQKYRRTFGLVAFTYACAHFAIYLVLDAELTWSAIAEDIGKRPYITIGFTALLLLVPLALTSTRASIKRLGKTWVKLHRLIYVVIVLGIIHYWMSVKKDISQPLLFSTGAAALLGWRVAVAARRRTTERPKGRAAEANA
jgi:sulfoxide reductase heme-binding subunit YedZ